MADVHHPQSKLSFDSGRPADALEACRGHAAVMVGTYELVNANTPEEQRVGTIHSISHKLAKTASTDVAGVFDMKWQPAVPHPMLGVAGADGALHLLTADCRPEGGVVLHEELASVPLDDPGDFCLSMGWSPCGSRAVFAARTGHVGVTDVETREREMWKGHDMEIWVAAFIDDTTVGTGSDDCRFRLWDTRTPDTPILTRRFDAGATAITAAWHPTGGVDPPHSPSDIIVVGSYDEQVHIIDRRNPRRDIKTFGPLGGGIWRIKRAPDCADRILVAAMQGGGYVIDTNTEEVVAHFEEHESMVYGCEWIEAEKGGWEALTCSFYDHVVHLWNPCEEEKGS